MDVVSIVIPTYNRPVSLRRALASIRDQIVPPDVSLEVIAVDNSPDGNARGIVESFAAAMPAIAYINETRTGVATARNTGVAAARGRWVAFLDDDEEAAPLWLARLVAAARTSGADAVFGPVAAKADGAGEIGPLAPYFSRHLDCADSADITGSAAYLGTNNSMFDRLLCLRGGSTFDFSLDETGGEDSLLLQKLVRDGRKFAWAREALVIEWAPERRLTWSYVRRRKFLSGQIRVFVQRMVGPARWDRTGFWMAAGLMQFIAGGAATVLLWPFNRERALHASATAWGGLGKVLWMPRFRPALYGTGLIS